MVDPTLEEPDVSVSVDNGRATGRAFLSARFALEQVLLGENLWWDLVVPAIDLQLAGLGLRTVFDPSLNPELGVEVYAINHRNEAVMWFDVPVELWCSVCEGSGTVELLDFSVECPNCSVSP